MISLETRYKPVDVGYDESRIDALNKHFEALVEKKQIIAASYCLARDGKVFAYNSVGKLSYREEDNRELRPDTIIRIASITKLFCSVAIWKLVEDGKLRVNQKVGEIIPQFNEKPFDEITIAHLLSHTSGLQSDYGTFENKYFVSPWDFIDKLRDEDWITASLRAGLRKKPGEEWAYCSFGFVILGEVITRISGEFANDYIMEHIVKPCGLKDTGFDYRNKEVLKRTNIPNEGREKFIDEVLSDTFVENESHERFDQIPSTGGGLYSTPYDLVRFGTMLQQGGYIDGVRVIGRKAIEKMTSQCTGPEIKDYCWNAGGAHRDYAYGPDLRCNDASLYSKGTFFHEGAGGCCLIIDPVEKLVAAWFIPFVNNGWGSEPLYNAAAIMWSGLK